MGNDAPIGVLLGADSLIGTRSGVGRQALEIARLLRQSPAVGELALLVGERWLPADALDALDDAPRPPGTRSIARTIAAALPGAAALHASWQRRRMNRLAAAMAQRMGGRVVYHEVNMIARPFDGVTVVTVHDLSWRADPSWHPAERVAWIERRLPGTLAQASRFVCVSDFTAGEMTRQLGIARSRIDVVHPGVSAIFRPVTQDMAAAALRRLDLADRGYIVAVSTLEPRKNFDRLLAAHAMLPQSLRQRFPLVIAGGRGWGESLSSDLADTARRNGVLRLLGHIADGDLVALYGRCAAFAYVSLYEGFGLPVLEAMACGAPVIASCTTAVGETAGDAALLVDPRDVDAIANALSRVVTDQALAAELARRGPRHAAGYDWGQMTEGLIASWRKALAG
jgi:glycosyltransferase involved in cell wall biosynthesis